MTEERHFGDRPAGVTVGLTDGRTLAGSIGHFRPAEPDLVFVARAWDAAGRPSESPQRVAAEQVAFVAIHRDDVIPGPSSGETVVLDVHVAGGQTFTVISEKPRIADRLGFWAVPRSASSAFGEIYFYTHGVNGLEERVRLGALLLETGALEGEGLARGLEVQASARSVPIGRILVEQKRLGEADVAAATAAQKAAVARGRRLRLGELLVEAGLAREEDIAAALEEQKKRRGKRIGEVLVDMGLVSELDIARALARKFNLPFVDLDEVVVDPKAVELVPADLIHRYRVLPLRADQTSLTIALSDPLAFEAIDMLRFMLGRRIVETVATPSQIARAIAPIELVRDVAEPADHLGAILSSMELEAAGDGPPDARDLAIARNDESAVAKLVYQVIVDALSRRASDIHIEPDGQGRETTVRFRIDGACETYRKFQPSLRSRLVARVKIMAKLDITERRKPQDGKIRVDVRGVPLELRVATIPTISGDEDVVLRLLSTGEQIPLDELDLSERNLSELRRVIAMPYGIVLAVGPTGSGKTTTLHSLLGEINSPVRKIWTAEDPVEITQPGLRQVQVQPRIGFDFAAALRAFLRADPDVIMVGEMRDRETAAIGIQASLTGHLVFSTLHTNSAPETVTRLVDIGLDPFSFSDSLLAVVAQRLVGRLCPVCRVDYEASGEERGELASFYGPAELEKALGGRPLRLFRSTGCARCEGRGHRGRVALQELLVADEGIRVAIQKRATTDEIRALAVAGGMRTLVQDGMEKCLAGLTDVRQVLAACSR